MIVILAISCGSEKNAPVTGELHIYNWDDYLAPDTLSDFEEEYGIKVTLDTFQDEQAMFSTVQSDTSRFDVIVASDSMISDMARQRLLAKIDTKAITNLENIDSEFLGQYWDPENLYSVPYTWGSTGIIYNKDYIPSPAKSWSLLRDPALSGHVALLNDPLTVIALTLKSLGYSLNSSDPEQVEEAVAVLVQQKSLLVGFLDPTTIREKMVSGELWAAQTYNGEAAFLMENNSNLAFFIPHEGSDIWVDNLAIPRDARNMEAATLFLNYILRPEVQADISNYTGYATPNRAALDSGLIDEELLANEASYPPWESLEAWLPMDSVQVSLWNRAWAEIQRGLPPVGY